MPPRMIRLVCQVPGCNHVFRNKSGLTKHKHVKHPLPLQINWTVPGPGFISSRSQSPIPGVEDEQKNPGFIPKEGTWVDMGRLLCVFHLHFTGRCLLSSPFTLSNWSVFLHLRAQMRHWWYIHWARCTSLTLYECPINWLDALLKQSWIWDSGIPLYMEPNVFKANWHAARLMGHDSHQA